ncbi:MAG: GntR family transcriptional regulator [Planctomycetia bacterium]|jgi:GntR family transcriptional regulator
MLFHVNPNDELPIYRQLVRQVKHALATGLLEPGDKLPSQREVSQELVINHLTVKKAYETLESQQVIHTLRGRGTFVVDPLPQSLFEDGLEQLDQDLVELVHTAKLLGISKSDFLKRLKRTWDT